MPSIWAKPRGVCWIISVKLLLGYLLTTLGNLSGFGIRWLILHEPNYKNIYASTLYKKSLFFDIRLTILCILHYSLPGILTVSLK